MKEKRNKLVKVKEAKPRAGKYEEKVLFDGAFDELINISIEPKKVKNKGAIKYTTCPKWV